MSIRYHRSLVIVASPNNLSLPASILRPNQCKGELLQVSPSRLEAFSSSIRDGALKPLLSWFLASSAVLA